MFDRIEAAWTALRRHPAFRAGAVYSGAAFVLLQVMDLLGFATATVRWTGVILAAGLVLLAVTLAIAHHRAPLTFAVGLLPHGRRLVAALAILFVAGTGAWWAGARLVAAPVAAGAETIAVLPFTATGPGADAMGEGMVDLLSTSLDQVGGVRAIHPRTVMHQWSRHASGGMLDLDGALAVGRSVGAGSVLLGSLVGTGDRVRLTAELYTLDGRRIGEARTEGQADAVLALVDDLAVRMLREVWRSRQPIPSLRLEAVTTSSVEALQDYLRGERHYRAARWDSAQIAFGDAVARDSTFALAHLRLAETYGWIHHHGYADAAVSARTAARLAERLPARERSMAQAYLLHAEADFSGLDTVASYVRRYPDDAMGWYLLGDVRYHAQTTLGLTVDQVVAPIDSVHRLDPGLSAPFVHPMELAILNGDSALFRRHLARFEQAGGDSRYWHRQQATRWADPGVFLDRFHDDFRELETRRGRYGSWFIWSATPLLRPDMDPDLTDAAIDRIRPGERPGVTADHVMELRLYVALARGRVDLAVSTTQQALTAGIEPWSLLAPFFDAVIAGAAPESSILFLQDRVTDGPPPEWFRKHYALAAGDPERAARNRLSGDEPLPDDAPEWVPAVIRALEGWELLVGGDTARGIDRIRQGITAAGYSGGATQGLTPTLFHFARHLARTDTGRDEGIRRLEALRLRATPPYWAPINLALAEAHEATGDRDAAARNYAEVLRLWRDADPHLQPAVESARRALARLGRD